ncbi:MAG TPA: amino acid permease [Lacipirellulaceae bacterium]|jgi:amino acid transporter|nr:amino acid permease [Lacipirellulaceae bacterium]
MPQRPPDSDPPIAPGLGLWDSVSIIVGIVVGTSIFRASPMIFDMSGSAPMALALWLVGGVLAWCGAACYAELATTYPRDGGDYEYLNRAFGSWCGFLFAWAQITTVISGNIGIMAYVFADYASHVWPAAKPYALSLTIGPIVALSALNALGVVAGKLTQNLLTAIKVIGLGGLVLAGGLATTSHSLQPPAEAAVTQTSGSTNLGLALVFVLYAYGGWTHAAYVAAEVRDQRRNLPRALTFGIVGIAIIYLLVNCAYLHALGFNTARHAATPAADVLEQTCGPWGGRVISVLVMLSALGAINGMILTGTRIYAVWGADYPALSWIGTWNRRTAAPIAAIALQAAIAVLLVLVIGTATGRDFFDAALNRIGLAALPWKKYSGGFETLVAGSAPVYWGLCLLTGFAVFILRTRDRVPIRPFSIPLFPVPAILFCATCGYMLKASIDYALGLSMLGVVPLLVGGIVWVVLQISSSHSRK